MIDEEIMVSAYETYVDTCSKKEMKSLINQMLTETVSESVFLICQESIEDER